MRFSSGLMMSSSPGKKTYDVTFKVVFMNGAETTSTAALSHSELNQRSDGDRILILSVLLRSTFNFKVRDDGFDASVKNARVLDVSLQPSGYKQTEVGRRIMNRARASRVNPLQSVTEIAEFEGFTSRPSMTPEGHIEC